MARDLPWIPFMDQTEFSEYLDHKPPSSSVIETFVKTFVTKNMNEHISTLIDRNMIGVNYSIRGDLPQFRIYSDKDRWTLLHLAVFEEKKPLIDMLVSRGADVNASSGDSYKYRPIHCAMDADVIERLVRAGAKIDAKDHRGATALFNAAIDGVALADRTKRLEIIKRLVDLGADVGAKVRWPRGNLLAGKDAVMIDLVQTRAKWGDEYYKKMVALFLKLKKSN